MIQNHMLNAGHFLKTSFSLLNRAVHIINDVKQSDKLNTLHKTEIDPVTTADLMAQFVIEEKYKEVYPGIKIFGEEAPASLIQSDISSIDHNASNFDESKFDHIQFPFEDCAVWIDPVDGTNEFVAGKLDEVTCMIALAVNGIPKIGLIATIWEPTDSESQKYKFNPSVYFAVDGVQNVFRYSLDQDSNVSLIKKFEPFGQENYSGKKLDLSSLLHRKDCDEL